MSDAKKKDGANPVAASKAPSKGAKGVCERLTKIFTLVSEIKDDPTGFAEHEAIVANRDSLKQQLGEKDASLDKQLQAKDTVINQLNEKVGELEIVKKSLIDDFETRCKEFGNRTIDHDSVKKDLEVAQDELRKSNEQHKATKLESDAAKRSLDLCQSNLTTMEEQLKYADDEVTKLRQQVEDNSNLLKQRTEELGVSQLIQFKLDKVASRIENLAEDCHKFAWQFFRSTIISDKMLGKLRQQLKNAKDFPLSTSRSPAAQLMRCAAAEHVIVSSMMEHIFVDLNLLGFSDAQSMVLTVLDAFETTQSSPSLRRRNIVRGQLLAEFPTPETHKDISESVMQNTVDQCDDLLSFMLSEDDSRSRFREELRVLCAKALNMWTPLRRSLQRIVAVSENNPDSDEYEDYDQVKLSETLQERLQGEESNVVLQLFPQIIADDEVLCPGYALFSNQRAAFGASNEEIIPSPVETVNGYGTAKMTRRLSTAQHTRRLSLGSGSVGLTSTRNRGHARPPQTASLPGAPIDIRNGV